MQYEFEYAFPEEFGSVAEGALTGAAGVALGIFMIIYLLALGFGIVSYVLSSLGMYRIASRRGIHHAWLAWVPVGNSWLLGSISDHYQYVVKHKNTRRRTVLLWLNLIMLFAGGALGAGLAMSSLAAGVSDGAVMFVALAFIGWLAMMGMAIAAMVFCYIAYYDLFQSCRPNYAVLFLVLSIFFNVAQPFFVFACSGSDQGMPARRRPQQIPPYQPPVQPAWQPPVPPVQPPQEEIPVVEAEIVEDPE